ncbi:hypothetical protein CTI12_AA549280 [Artemisia annua]|uniref:RING-type domain-containing protein n=1 Tax=Artemisia annua TaxID=35608 RepID=A0A2U1KYD7_ARTAN|nr:hypothetical protein CTI12_AA549280 [Artemisia annua]
MDSVEHVYDDGMMNKTAEPNTRASKWELEKEKLVLNNVSELLECPVCLTIMSAPIYQCPNGHTLCSMCKFRVKNCCPICCTYMGSIRCLALEKVAKPLEVPYECPLEVRGCKVTGNIPELITHIKNAHAIMHDGMHDGSRIAIDFVEPLPRSNWTWRLNVYKCYGCYFCFYLKRFTSGNATGDVAYIRFMGEENEAKIFSYSLEIGGDGQKLTYKGVPRSIRVRNENFLKEGMFVSPSFWEENEHELRLKLNGQISQN